MNFTSYCVSLLLNFEFSITVLNNTNQTITFIKPVTPKSSHGVSLVYHLPDGENCIYILNSLEILDMTIRVSRFQVTSRQPDKRRASIWICKRRIQFDYSLAIFGSQLKSLLNIKPSLNIFLSMNLARK
jgi:hypothetical protein